MKKIHDIIQHIAPTIASALRGPFSGVALHFITTNLGKKGQPDGACSKDDITNLLLDHENLNNIRGLDELFKQEMVKINVDVFSLEDNDEQKTKSTDTTNHSPQIIISTFFLFGYFLMLAAIFTVEVSDTLNMRKGENSLMGELQILFGVLTAGVVQVLSYWFSGLLGKKGR